MHGGTRDAVGGGAARAGKCRESGLCRVFCAVEGRPRTHNATEKYSCSGGVVHVDAGNKLGFNKRDGHVGSRRMLVSANPGMRHMSGESKQR